MLSEVSETPPKEAVRGYEGLVTETRIAKIQAITILAWLDLSFADSNNFFGYYFVQNGGGTAGRVRILGTFEEYCCTYFVGATMGLMGKKQGEWGFVTIF